MKPRSKLIPSVCSNSSSNVLPSLTVMTPSRPTFSIALAINSPTLISPLAEMVATWAISSDVVIICVFSFKCLTTSSTAAEIPLRRSMGLRPAVTFFSASEKMACAKTVAVVVPSPASSFVL
eukprot:Lithocolla_globosa_v1_NODE_2031_length_2200_cov_406.434033.p3 type:complete len:122 gc:universal NODE_2031_length_2200_cov_406.434033:1096-731(-)